MFKPKYTITDKIINNLTFIASARTLIEQSRIVPQWEAKLRRQAILKNTHSSTSIEGNKMTLHQVEDLAQGKKVIATEKDKQEVLNYLKALEKIPGLGEKGKLSTDTLLNIHKIITKNTLENNSDCGVCRNRQVFVGRRVFDGTGYKTEVTYMPPETKKVPGLIKEFISWLNLEKTWEINPVLIAGIVHYEIARIHPFIDGNGRTARLFATLILYLSGFDHRQFFALDDFYDTDRQAYYEALKTAQKNNNDITKWLEYFTTGVAYSASEVKEAVIKLGSGSKKVSGMQIALAPRQMEIIEFIKKNGKITVGDISKKFNITRQAALKEIAKLTKLKVVKLQGKGRTAHYKLA